MPCSLILTSPNGTCFRLQAFTFNFCMAGGALLVFSILRLQPFSRRFCAPKRFDEKQLVSSPPQGKISGLRAICPAACKAGALGT